MNVTVIGTGFIGSTLGRALSNAGHQVTFGSRHPDDVVSAGGGANVTSIEEALLEPEVIILAIPGAAVSPLSVEYGNVLAGKLIIDATNQMGADVPNARASLPSSVRYARAFNTLGGENMANPVFADGRADMFFSSTEDDRPTVEEVIDGVGLRPVYVGEDQEALVDALFQLWIALAITQGRGRRLAFRLLER